jgi:PAS domain S-box-containing protein
MLSPAKLMGRLWSLLPSGGSLPEDVWARRHRFLLGLTWVHALVIAMIGPLLGYSRELSLSAFFHNGTVLHTIGEGLFVGFFALIAGWKGVGREFRATMVGFGLMSASAIFVHLSGGTIELHFHFFVMLTFLALYQDWVPYIFAIVYVAVHHGVVGVLWPEDVYNHAAAFNAPWTWAGIHAFFVLWASVGSLIAWRFNETSFARTKLILDVAGDGIFGLEAEGKITFANHAAARMLGAKRRDIVGRQMRKIVDHLKADGSQFPDGTSPIVAALRDGASCVSSDEIFRRNDGTSLVVDYVSNPIFERGSLTGAVVAFTDVTNRKRSEEELQARFKELAILHEVGQMIFASTDLKAVLENILEQALALVSLDLGNIRLFERHGRMQTGAYRGYRDPKNIGKHAQMNGADGRGLVRRIVASGKSWVAEDITTADGLRTFKEEGVRSAILVPITTGKEMLGIIEVGNRTTRKYRSDELRLLEAIGSQIGIAVQKARLFEETERRAQEQAALNAIAMATSQSLRLDETLQIALDKVLEVTGREQGYIRLKDPTTGNLVLTAHRGISENFVETLLNERTPGGKSDQVFESGEPLIINDPETSPLKEQIRREGIRCFAWVPLKVRGRAVGIMNVSTAHLIPFQPREVELLKAIGNVIGVALENASLFQETERRNDELQARNHELEILHAISDMILDSLDLKIMMERILDRAFEIGKFDIALVRLIDPAESTLELMVHRGYRDTGNLASHRNNLERYTSGSTARIIVDKMVQVIDLAASRGQRTFKKEGVRTLVAVPLQSHDDVLGVIHLGSRSEQNFSEGELRLLQAIGGQAGIAVQKARLYEEANRAENALEQKAAELARSNADLKHSAGEIKVAKEKLEKVNSALTIQAAELARSNTELQHFAYVASHDLQEPLRMVASYVQLLARRYQGKLDSDADEFIAFAIDGATRMQALINALLTYSRVGTQAKEFGPTDCDAVLDTILAGLKAAIEDSSAVITRDPLPMLMGDGTQLGQLFQNLIGNGIKFRGAVAPQIHISSRRNGKGWIFSVRDHGIGIDSRYAERIFVMFQRLHAKGEYPGTGIGLAICKKIVERHGGKIWVESRPGDGSTFYFTIPMIGDEQENHDHEYREHERFG